MMPEGITECPRCGQPVRGYGGASLCEQCEPPFGRYPAIGVSGSRTIPLDRWSWVTETFHNQITRLNIAGFVMVNGACIGVDEHLGRWWGYETSGIWVHAVVPPDRTRCSSDWREWCRSHEDIAPGPDGYKRRNQRIIDLADRLIAFPSYPEAHPESRRSGTWQTIRMAQRKGIPVDWFALHA
jgi:hypothetical protein